MPESTITTAAMVKATSTGSKPAATTAMAAPKMPTANDQHCRYGDDCRVPKARKGIASVCNTRQ